MRRNYLQLRHVMSERNKVYVQIVCKSPLAGRWILVIWIRRVRAGRPGRGSVWQGGIRRRRPFNNQH
jgi:hypothetical protein